MKKVAMIPARYASTRFPFKLMQLLGNKTVIRHTYENAVATHLFDEVLVVTDHSSIYEEITSHGGRAIMSKNSHESGSDRIAEVAAGSDADIILNVQGDEPFMQKESLKQLLEAFEGEEGLSIQVASLMKKIEDLSLVSDYNVVKVVVDKKMRSLLFSRSPIPYYRDTGITPIYYEHIGVYAFRKAALLQFTKWPPSLIEQVEKLEQLRYLDNGIQLKMVETDFASIKIDVPGDLAKANSFLNNR